MKKIRIALSIVVLFGTMAVVGVSNSQAKLLGIERITLVTPDCDCEFENPHGWGVYDANHQCQEIRCQHDAQLE